MKAFDRQVGGDHYKHMQIQPTEFIEANNLSFLEGCVVKRICRWRRKNGIEDLRKIQHEVDMLIELHHKEIAQGVLNKMLGGDDGTNQEAG